MPQDKKPRRKASDLINCEYFDLFEIVIELKQTSLDIHFQFA